MQSVGVYIHIPFCAKKCGYCDFNAYSGYKDATKSRYVEALCSEIAANATDGILVPTIFFGGGTPSLLPVADLARILDITRASFPVAADAEISIEANPSDASPEFLEGLATAGFNRLSFGVQTFNDRLLKTIDRLHSASDAETAVRQAARAGFSNISLDLMFGLPRQTLADFDRSLDAAFALEIPHLSIYGLIVEERTPFYARRERGKLPLPSEQVETDMFAHAIERTMQAGLMRYEISNYARPGYESRHNQIYWRNDSYFGFGAGATGYRNGLRSSNERLPGRYADTVLSGASPVVWSERLTDGETMGETMMVGLRLAKGVDLNRFFERFGIRAEQRFASAIQRNTDRGLLETVDGAIRLTPRGLFLASEAMVDFLE